MQYALAIVPNFQCGEIHGSPLELIELISPIIPDAAKSRIPYPVLDPESGIIPVMKRFIMDL